MAAPGSVTLLHNPPLRIRSAAVVASCRSDNKHVHRLLSSLVRADPAGADRLIRKFVAGTSKQTTLEALSHLTSLPDYPTFAISMYQTIAKAPWFRWSPAPAAAAAALLEKTGRLPEAEALIHESTSDSARSPRETELFYCALMEQAARQGLESRVSYTRALLQNKSGAAGKRVRESTVRALCLLRMPREAEAAAADQGTQSQSGFEMRVVAQAYGKLGLFEDMERVIATATAAEALDAVTANVAISCYGERGMLREIASWLRRMREAVTPVSIRTFNAALNACPTVSAMVREEGIGPGLPISLPAMAEALRGNDEADVLAELTAAPVVEAVLQQAAKWGESEWKLDLHGCHASAALVVFMMWVDELRHRVVTTTVGKEEVVVVCGAGKHSNVRGESPVRAVVGRVAAAMQSPLRVDRKNNGRFVAKGKAVSDWLISN